MKTCPRCNNLADDSAASCAQCGMVLNESVIARAARPRIPTVTEAPGSSFSPPPSTFEYRPSPPPFAEPHLGVPTTAGGGASATTPPMAKPPGRRGQTVYMPGPSAGATGPSTPPALASRRILAVLVTYSWKPKGQIFPIREGRNLIGRGDECDVRLPEDPQLSSTNTHITYRQNFTVGDMVSMGGTDLDGTPVEEQFRPLNNLARIRAGSTNFVFVVVDPALLAST